MRIVYYYRANDPALINAKAADMMHVMAMREAGMVFAKVFGTALPVETHGFAPRFAGITFQKGSPPPANGWLVWSKPQPHNPVMFPLNSNHVPRKHAALANKMHVLFKQHWPEEFTKEWDSALLTALGISSKDVVGNALNVFYGPDMVTWVASTMKLDGKSLPVDGTRRDIVDFSEMKASDFDAAHTAFQAWDTERNLAEQAALAAKVGEVVQAEPANEGATA